MFLVKQYLPFRCRREYMSSENKGNFLQLIELLSKYDPILRQHLIKLEQSTQSQTVKKLRRKKAADEPLTVDQELKKSMLRVIDRFQQEIDTRCEGMECISEQFAVLEPSNLIETSETELPKFVQSLIENYNELS
ncbi:hypothetical protein AVEN_249549-1 [Araneus ventricosus]|uniref:Uncharacterized protein n=1 Tax=Araneus ventricosus TaxID=182803 RepID=A0A4Y2KJX3_ARAVE|nr:hypothetical protein AVEN_249549-1 [Araneus ventricosus]